VPFRSPASFKDRTTQIEYQVVDVVRDATKEVMAANSLNKEPTPGNAYVLVKLKTRYIAGPEDQPWGTPTSGFSIFTANRMFGDAPGLVVTPEPKFGGVNLFPGAEFEGWLPVFEVPREALDTLILSVMQSPAGAGQTWFALQ
jgi:hypothetical protein